MNITIKSKEGNIIFNLDEFPPEIACLLWDIYNDKFDDNTIRLIKDVSYYRSEYDFIEPILGAEKSSEALIDEIKEEFIIWNEEKIPLDIE